MPSSSAQRPAHSRQDATDSVHHPLPADRNGAAKCPVVTAREPINPDVSSGKILESYQRMDLGADDPRMQKALGEVAPSTKAHGDNDQWATHQSPTTDSSTVATTPGPSSGTATITNQLRVTRYGVVNASGYALYVGYRWKERLLYTHVTEDKSEFYTTNAGELLFSFPLPIRLTKHPAGTMINIRYVEGRWHRAPPRLDKNHP